MKYLKIFYNNKLDSQIICDKVETYGNDPVRLHLINYFEVTEKPTKEEASLLSKLLKKQSGGLSGIPESNAQIEDI